MPLESYLPLVFPLTAGALALFSPCAYALLPGYMSYCLGTSASVGRAALGGVLATLGLLTVVSMAGVLSGLIGEVVRLQPKTFGLISGGIIILMGVGMIFDVKFPSASIPLRPKIGKGVIGLYVFGLAYGLAVSSCTAPIFVSVVIYAMDTGGLLQSVLVCITYAAGAGVPLVATGMLIAYSKKMILERIKSVTPILHRVAGVVLIVVGVYLIVTQLI